MKCVTKSVLFSLFSIGVTFTVVLVCFNNFVSDNLSKKQIFNLVEKNNGIIIEDIADNDFSDTLLLKGVKKVKNIDAQNCIISFECGGKGFGSATSYYGFYYSENDEPIGIYFGTNIQGDFELMPNGNSYSYTEENSDNTYYTERIIKNFFYYESHF